MADAAVIGVPDDQAGEIPVDFVVVRPDHETSEADIMSFVAGQVADFEAAMCHKRT